MISLRPDKDIDVEKIRIGKMSALVLSPKEKRAHAPGVLWIHGGGYITGMKEMVHMSRAVDLVKEFGAVVISPGYRLAFRAPYPAAIDDCYQALLYLRDHAEALGVSEELLMAGVEAEADVYPCNIHAFDMLKPELLISKEARKRFLEHFGAQLERCGKEKKVK